LVSVLALSFGYGAFFEKLVLFTSSGVPHVWKEDRQKGKSLFDTFALTFVSL
jgi:hypothetical protein